MSFFFLSKKTSKVPLGCCSVNTLMCDHQILSRVMRVKSTSCSHRTCLRQHNTIKNHHLSTASFTELQVKTGALIDDSLSTSQVQKPRGSEVGWYFLYASLSFPRLCSHCSCSWVLAAAHLHQMSDMVLWHTCSTPVGNTLYCGSIWGQHDMLVWASTTGSNVTL